MPYSVELLSEHLGEKTCVRLYQSTSLKRARTQLVKLHTFGTWPLHSRLVLRYQRACRHGQAKRSTVDGVVQCQCGKELRDGAWRFDPRLPEV